MKGSNHKKGSHTAIVIAAHNEEEHIAGVVKKAGKHSKMVIVVDDGSKDKTALKAKNTKAVVISHKTNYGKGKAMKTGADFAVKKKARAIVFLDGDGQHDPDEIPKFVKALEKHDIAFGARKRNSEMPFIFKFGNWFISKVVSILYNIKIHDSQNGYRAVSAPAYKKIKWKSDDYSVESEMIANARKAKLNYCEIPTKTIYHSKYKGTSPSTGIKIVCKLIGWRFLGKNRK